MTKLSILIPIYNEERTLETIVKTVLEQPIAHIAERELILVNDGSTDRSSEIMTKLANEHDCIKIFHLPYNQGKGAAIAQAIQEGSGDIAIIQDADLEYNPSDYDKIFEPILNNQADVVYGSRFLMGTRRVLYFKHALGNRFLTLLSNLCTDLYVTDMETCYKAFKLHVMKTIPLRSKRFGIEPEITAKIAKRGLRVFEVPISYNGRTYEEGKKIGWKDGVSAIFTILKYKIIDDMFEKTYGHQILEEMQEAPKFIEWTVDKIKHHIGSSLLEVGSGIGNNIQHLHHFSQNILATDIEEKYLAILNNRFGMTKQTSLASPSNFKASQWDVTEHCDSIGTHDTLFCSNVLEHIPKETDALQNMYNALKPGGKLILIVPQGNYLFCQLDKNLDHCRRYDPEKLSQKLQSIGFTIIESSTFNKPGVLGWLWRGKVLNTKTLGKHNLKLFNTLVPLFRLVDAILPWKGLSCIAVAQKP